MAERARRGLDDGLDRVTIQDAARRLGVSEGAVRKRVTRPIRNREVRLHNRE
jgi:DNA-directed RNA polymerase specialized sigma24 family protein